MQSVFRQMQPVPDPVPRAAAPPLRFRVLPTVVLLSAIAVVLGVMGTVTQYLYLAVAQGGAGGRISTLAAHLFALDGEGNIPAWFQGSMLLCSAWLFWLASGARRETVVRHVGAWRALAVIFVLMSCDEISSVHETIGFWLSARLNPALGVYAWLLLGIPFAAIVGLSMIRLLRDLRPPTRWGLLIAGAVYVSGAAGVEVYEAFVDARLFGTFAFVIATVIEESLESAGLIILIGVLLAHLRASDPLTVETR